MTDKNTINDAADAVPQAPRGIIYLWPDSLLLAGRLPPNRKHRHVPASLLFSLDAPFRLDVNGVCRETRAALVAPEVPQALDPGDNRMLVIHLDPDGAHWGALRSVLGQQNSCDLELAPDTCAALFEEHSLNGARQQLETLVASFASAPSSSIDERVQRVAQRLREELPERLDVSALASEVALSESRLRHLFREQTGVTLRRFLLHLKMRKVFAHWRPSVRLSELAMEAGFYDQPHLTRAARDMYDALPSAYIAAGSFDIVKA